MTEDRIYLTFDEELRKLLAANPQTRKDIEAELRKDLPKAKLRPASLPLAQEAPERDIVLVIIAAGVTASLVAGAISRVLDAISRGKQATMKEIHLKPALDGNGKPICNSKGEPVYERTEKPGIQTPPGEVSSMKVGIPKVLEFELATGKPKGQ